MTPPLSGPSDLVAHNPARAGSDAGRVGRIASLGSGLLDATGRQKDPSGAPGLVLNIESIVGTGFGGTFTWTRRVYDRPVMIVGLTVYPSNAAGSLPNQAQWTGSLRFAPYIQPRTIDEAKCGTRRLTAHLDHAGEWWLLYYDPKATPSKLVYAVIDASNPITAASYLSLYGAAKISHTITAHQATYSSVIPSTMLLPQNINRVAVAITNRSINGAPNALSNNLAVAYNIDGSNVASQNGYTFPGFILDPEQTDVLVGDTLSLASYYTCNVSRAAVTPPNGTATGALAGDVIAVTEWSL